MKHMLILLIAVILCIGPTFAHGDEQHVMGTVTKIADNTISVEVAAKKGQTRKTTVIVNVVASTKFEQMGSAATIEDLKVGDRVVIHAGKKDGQLEAHVVKIGMAMKH